MIRFCLIGIKKEEQLIIDIKNVFEKYKFNIKTKQGYDYDFR